MDFDMDMEFKFGQMVPNMRVTGKIMWPAAKANFITLMVMFMMVNFEVSLV